MTIKNTSALPAFNLTQILHQWQARTQNSWPKHVWPSNLPQHQHQTWYNNQLFWTNPEHYQPSIQQHLQKNYLLKTSITIIVAKKLSIPPENFTAKTELLIILKDILRTAKSKHQKEAHSISASFSLTLLLKTVNSPSISIPALLAFVIFSLFVSV